jgi:hypothetical protein
VLYLCCTYVVPITTTLDKTIACVRMPDAVAEPEHISHYTIE